MRFQCTIGNKRRDDSNDTKLSEFGVETKEIWPNEVGPG
ncbi:hypothetical protein LINGRAPRIM_LOCUS66 [Linum grandiflorum]